MGLFFENIHIRKSAMYDTRILKNQLIRYFEEKGFQLAPQDAEESVSVVIYEPENSAWVSIASELFQLETEEDIQKVAEPLSQCFETDIISAGCYDSDYLRLSLLNVCDGTDGWINVGRAEGMKLLRRTSLVPWKKVVDDMDALKKLVKAEYVFAEEAFYELATLINMTLEQASLEADYVDGLAFENVTTLKFIVPEGNIKLPEFVIRSYNGMPCQIGKSEVVSVYNNGGKSKGIGIMFIGDYVDNDEITFEDVKLQLHTKKGWEFIPIELKKVDWIKGKKCYYWSDANFPLPPAVSESIPLMKRMNLEFEKEIGIRFTPIGNPRKVLDIKLVVYPLANSMEGQTSWYVYRYAGSKRKYIEEHNSRWKDIPFEPSLSDLLNPEDYDLD